MAEGRSAAVSIVRVLVEIIGNDLGSLGEIFIPMPGGIAWRMRELADGDLLAVDGDGGGLGAGAAGLVEELFGLGGEEAGFEGRQGSLHCN